MGAMIGGAVGMVERQLVPYLAIPVGAYALVGMGTLFAGILRAPMTSVFMILEVSGNYSIIVPVILSNAIAYFISRTFQPTPMFDLLSRQDGLDLPSLEEEREVATAARRRCDASAAGPDTHRNMAVARRAGQVQGSAQEFFVVGMGGDDWSGISRAELLDMIANSDCRCRVCSAHRIPYLHPGHHPGHGVAPDWRMAAVAGGASRQRAAIAGRGVAGRRDARLSRRRYRARPTPTPSPLFPDRKKMARESTVGAIEGAYL